MERIHRVTNVVALEDTRLLLEFDNMELRIFDVKKLQDNKLFQKIIDDKEYFSKVYIDDMGLVCWDESTDINPYFLYDESEPGTPAFLDESMIPAGYYNKPNPYLEPPKCPVNILELSRYAKSVGKKINDLSEEEIKRFMI